MRETQNERKTESVRQIDDIPREIQRQSERETYIMSVFIL